MSTDTDLIKLYSGRILALAADIPLGNRLDNPDATVKKRSPLCGSVVTVDVQMKDNKIAAFGQDVKACALGQAAASILAAKVIGQNTESISRLQDQLLAMLKNDGPVPSAPFDEFKVLGPAKEYKNRHASIMLAVDATLEAMQKSAAT